MRRRIADQAELLLHLDQQLSLGLDLYLKQFEKDQTNVQTKKPDTTDVPRRR